jgi:tRNA(Ile)-lysidine synthase
MRYIVAVSGGIDSVVLLDMLASKGDCELIVAHFDHGIRTDSAADARFVRELAARYSLPFVMKREELGPGVSEEQARDRRYAFLRSEAAKHDAHIVTAHHGDDVIETIAINVMRGTGWRGMAILSTPEILRPLLDMTKRQIREYALMKRLEWVEDSTNAETQYLRNRLRRKISRLFSDEQKRAVLDAWERQVVLKAEIDTEVRQFIRKENTYDRYFLIMIDSMVASEVLRMMIITVVGAGPTRPQLERSLLAVKTTRSGALYEVGDGVRLRFTSRTFIVETP